MSYSAGHTLGPWLHWDSVWIYKNHCSITSYCFKKFTLEKAGFFPAYKELQRCGTGQWKIIFLFFFSLQTSVQHLTFSSRTRALWFSTPIHCKFDYGWKSLIESLHKFTWSVKLVQFVKFSCVSSISSSSMMKILLAFVIICLAHLSWGHQEQQYCAMCGRCSCSNVLAQSAALPTAACSEPRIQILCSERKWRMQKQNVSGSLDESPEIHGQFDVDDVNNIDRLLLSGSWMIS